MKPELQVDLAIIVCSLVQRMNSAGEAALSLPVLDGVDRSNLSMHMKSFGRISYHHRRTPRVVTAVHSCNSFS